MSRFARKKALSLPTALRPYAAHLPAIGFLLAALVLIVLNQFFPATLQNIRTALIDGVSPVMHATAVPADVMRDADVMTSKNRHAENKRLRDENAKLKTFIQMARQYEAENKHLRALNQYKDDTALQFLTARVIGVSGGNFSRSAIITAGADDGVTRDMVALTEDGVVGRVIEVGKWSSRILLLQDLNFRLPVQIEDVQEKAILSGEGEAPLQLNYVPPDIALKAGMRIATSGHGGLFPPHLPVGIIEKIEGRKVYVRPYADIARLYIVRLAQYTLPGGAGNPMNQNSKGEGTREGRLEEGGAQP